MGSTETYVYACEYTQCKELYERNVNVIGKLNFLFENIRAEGFI